MSDHALLSRHLKKASDDMLASLVSTSCSNLLQVSGSYKSVFLSLWSLATEISY